MVKANSWITIYILMSFYYFLQAHIYKNYLEGRVMVQWIMSAALFLSWIVLGFLANDFETYMRYQVIAYAVVLLILKRGKFHAIQIQWKFWKQVLVYSIYSFTGGLGPMLAAYFVQFRYGLGNELNWFRYGTRELPVLPAWLAGFGQSYLKGALDSTSQLEVLKKGVTDQIRLLIIPLCILIVFSEPLFSVVFGLAFSPAAGLMSIYLLIYIPRMIFSQVVLQARQYSTILLASGGIELVAMIAAAVLLVPAFGLVALVWIIVVGSLLEKLMHIAYLWFKLGIPLDTYLPVKPYLIFAIALMMAYAIKIII